MTPKAAASEAIRTPRRRKVSVAAFSRSELGDGNLVTEVTAQIRDRIERGVFADGSRLPSERDLAEELGISRAVLRESLRGLESLGYLEARVGQGRFVVGSAASADNPRALDEWLRGNQPVMRDFVELRAAIESQALRGGRGDPAAIAAELAPIVEAQARAFAEDRPDDAAELDLEFHVRLSGFSDNRPLRTLATALILRSRQAAAAAYRVPSYRHGSLRQHRAILAALRSGYRDGAADLLYEHHLSRYDQLGSYLERESSRPADGADDGGREAGGRETAADQRRR